jgi:NitT/TauT family transport system substrate-binding protein
MPRLPVRLVMALLPAVGLLIQACGASAPPPAPTSTPPAPAAADPTQAPAPVKLKVVNLPFISFAPFHIAIAEGYFAEQGLEVELVELTQTQEVIPALLAGEVDVAAGLTTAGLINTIARGGDLKIVADKGYVDPNGCDNIAFIARGSLADAGDPEVLRGKTVDVVSASWNEYFLDRQLAAAGLAPGDIVRTYTPTTAQPEALTQARIDYTVLNEPWIYRLESMGHQRVFVPSKDLLPNSQTAVTFYGPRLLGENAPVGERFMIAYLKAVRQYNEGKTERNVDILAAANNLDAETLNAMCWPALHPDGLVNTDSLLDFQAWAIEAGHVEQALTLEQLWDPRFTAAAVQALGQ